MVPNLYLFLQHLPRIVRPLIATALIAAPLRAADEPAPRTVIMTSPLSIPAATITKLRLRGIRLDDVVTVQSETPDTAVQLLGKATAAVPSGLDQKRVGNSQIELELSLPHTASGEIPLKLIFPNDEIVECKIRVEANSGRIAETEPNDGFATAQPLRIPALVDGEIHADRNVDLFALEIKESQTISVTIRAREFGSGLDSLLTLYDAQRRVIAVHDDQPESVDSRISRLLAPGRYFIALQDANDHGGSAQPYQLLIHSEE
jgi:hypothetical protein